MGAEKKEERTFRKQLEDQRMTLMDQKPKREQLKYIFHLILNQRRLVYSAVNALAYFGRCFHWRKNRSLKGKKWHNSEKDFVLNQGIKKLTKDLDIVNLLEMIKGYKTINEVLFNKEDIFFMKNQRRDIIDSQSESYG